MANIYTPKLNLAKPAHGDVNWHIPNNGNWDKIDTELDKALKIRARRSFPSFPICLSARRTTAFSGESSGARALCANKR